MTLHEDGDKMEAEILAHVPLGTSSHEAVRAMEHNRFYCAAKNTPDGNSYIWCDLKKPKAFGVDNRWLVTIHLEDDRVSGVDVTYGMIGL